MRLKSDVNIKNRRASFDYEIIDRYMAGIQLFGTEIKSIRESKASLVDTYCQFVGKELWVKQMHIAEYRFGSFANHEAKRDRKLLLTKKELNKLEKQVSGDCSLKGCCSRQAGFIFRKYKLAFPAKSSFGYNRGFQCAFRPGSGFVERSEPVGTCPT